MGIFKTGFSGYAQELQDTKKEQDYLNKFFIKVGEMKEVVVLDDTGFRFNMYGISTPRGAAAFRSLDVVCNTEDPSQCILSKYGFSPTLVTVVTIKNLSGYFKSNGEKAGVGERQLLILKPTSAKLLDVTRQTVLQNKAEEMWNTQRAVCEQRGLKSLDDVKNAIMLKGNVLKNSKITIGRTDSKSAATGNYFMFSRWIKQEELTQNDVPFNYEEVFKIKTDEEIMADVIKFHEANQMPMTWQHNVNTGVVSSGNTQGTQNKGANFQSQINSAPSDVARPFDFSADDIPF